jgi:antitoxin component of MazEF toxin-antitoxin module
VTVPREYADAIGMIKGSIVRVTVRDDKTLCVAVEERLYDPQKTILRPAPGA